MLLITKSFEVVTTNSYFLFRIVIRLDIHVRTKINKTFIRNVYITVDIYKKCEIFSITNKLRIWEKVVRNRSNIFTMTRVIALLTNKQTNGQRFIYGELRTLFTIITPYTFIFCEINIYLKVSRNSYRWHFIAQGDAIKRTFRWINQKLHFTAPKPRWPISRPVPPEILHLWQTATRAMWDIHISSHPLGRKLHGGCQRAVVATGATIDDSSGVLKRIHQSCLLVSIRSKEYRL